MRRRECRTGRHLLPPRHFCLSLLCSLLQAALALSHEALPAEEGFLGLVEGEGALVELPLALVLLPPPLRLLLLLPLHLLVL